jgi:hypothetical protein
MVIVTDGLEIYYNSKQGVNGATWQNITPNKTGRNGVIGGTALQADGLYLDGIDDYIISPINETIIRDFTIDIVLKSATSNFENSIDLSLYVEGFGDGAGLFIGTVGIIGGYVYIKPNGTNYLLGSGVTGFSLRYTKSIGELEYVFPNGSKFTSISGTQLRVNNVNYKSKSFINAIRYYSRALSDAEIANNYSIGSEIGLSAPTPPIISSLTVNKLKISDETGMNQSIITIQFDKNFTQYVARLNGVDQNTGTLVHSGGALLANTNAQIIVDWNELSAEGQNRINIYGQNANGWTAYNS